MASIRDDVEVTLVMVPPSGDGVAYGHDAQGRCVSIRAPRDRLLTLFHRLREEGRKAKPARVYVDDSLATIAAIADAECPTHMLPEVPAGSIVAWAPY